MRKEEKEMKGKENHKIGSRVLAAVLSILMVLSLVPTSTWTVLAATPEYPETVTITVKDEAGQALSGAIVDYKINSVINGEEYQKNTVLTDDNGVAAVLVSGDYVENDLTICASISKDGYETDESIKDYAINASDENYDIILKSKNIEGITVTPVNAVYSEDESGKAVEYEAVEVTGTQEGDTVTYCINNEECGKTVPIISDVGDYQIKVTVKRNGYLDCEQKVTAQIKEGTLSEENIKVTPLNRGYKEENGEMVKSKAVEVSGLREGDSVTYQMDGQEYSISPEIGAVGKYEITVKVKRNNYEDYEKTYEAVITPIDIEGLKAVLYSGVYDGKEYDSVKKIDGTKDGDVIEYKLSEDGAEDINSEEGWSEKIPKVKDAGSYIVGIRVKRGNNYNITKIIEFSPQKITIEKAEIKDEDFYFENKLDEIGDNNQPYKELSLDDKNGRFDFKSIVSDKIYEKGMSIKYSATNASENDTEDIKNIVTISEDRGELIARKVGNVKVTATLQESKNYKAKSINCYVTIAKHLKKDKNGNKINGELVYFDKASSDYIVGTNEVIAKESPKVKYEDEGDNGDITYSASAKGSSDKEIKLSDLGIKIAPANGELTIDGESASNDENYKNYKKLCDQLENNDSIKITITAKKKAVQKGLDLGNGKIVERTIYDEDEASYTVNISFLKLESPETNYYSIKENANEVGWYNTKVTIESNEGYEIANDEDLTFGKNAVFSDQGEGKRKFYLQNKETKGITAPIGVDMKIDTVAPSKLEITYSDPKRTKDSDSKRFYDDTVKVEATFTAQDDTSGVKSFTWNYQREADVSESNLEKASGTVTNIEKVTKNGETYYQGTVILKLQKKEAKELEQLRGYLTVEATDNADLTSDKYTDDGNIVVVDTISPTAEVSYCLADATDKPKPNTVIDEKDGKDHHYYAGDVNATFTITEANFFAEDIVIKVNKAEQKVKWVNKKDRDGKSTDVYYATITLSGDNDYVVTMEYKDRMAHKGGEYVDDFEAYNSEDGVGKITIDTTPPEVSFDYSNGNNKSASADNSQSATVTIKEHNFRASDIEVVTDVKNIKDEKVEDAKDLQEILRNANWEKKANDEYVATLSSTNSKNKALVDGIYNVTINYKDLALNPAKEEKSGEFIVDHTAPSTSSMKVSYSTPLLERVISAITFGYYNPDVKVDFEAKDITSGVDYFTWSYMKEEGASGVNVSSYADTKVTAKQDSSDKSKFTASITLPNRSAEQLRGRIAFTATDKYSNVSNKITDTKHILVVDTIAPTMTAEYTESSRTVGNTMYYNKNMTATFTVTEANFYKEDVVIEMSKNGGAFNPINVVWNDLSTDVHVATYTIEAASDHSQDADYIFRVNYTDRSNNKMATYTSNTLTMDTINPVIDVVYSNTNATNTLGDSENHTRQYFKDTQTATVTVTEHNFEASEVAFTIIARDVTGRELNADSLNSKSEWSSNGDTHTITITYPGDANYTFDVAYTDLATNEAADYAEDYFTVDKTAPSSLNISYSNSVLETILQAVSFGFYNAPTTVTITANDDISSVHEFKYDCTLASGVSSVNAELINQAIDESGVTYSNGRDSATTQFNIPKGTLGSGNQFNGFVGFTTVDRAGNESAKLNDTKEIVVDNIAPTANVTYNSPVQVSGGISYYDKAVTATVTVDEANFYSDDVQVTVTKDGSTYPVIPSWSNNSADIHVGTFELSDDGDYFVTIDYTDKSSNKMATYTSEQMTVDTKIEKPVITVNGEEADGKAFKDEVVPAVSFEDINYESYEIKLTRTRYDEKDTDVTETFIGSEVLTDEKGGSGSFDKFPKEQDIDGIYKMTVSMKDKAGHLAETSATFTVNRFGSVYKYNGYLSSLIQDGGAYVQQVESDLVITEYNADKLVDNSLDIEVLRDGKPLSDVDYEVTPEVNDKVAVGDSGWYQYKYTIHRDNFAEDGVYKVSVSSKDETGNAPEITNYKDKSILFRVDSTAPEIDSITGFEESIINAQSVNAKYTVYDTIGLKSVKVYVNDKEVDNITDFSKDANNYNGKFTVSEKNEAQKVRLVVEDLAGNVTDTNSKSFKSAYAFNKVVTISTNFFVRFIANKRLLFGTIIGVVVVIGGTAGFVFFRKRRKNAAGNEE
jgi:hypothetical protein